VARNRKRAKERRARRQPAPSASRARLAAAELEDAPPDPIEHAAPDVELAEAQLEVGRPELEPGEEPITEEELEAEEEREAEEHLRGEDEILAEQDHLTDGEFEAEEEAEHDGAVVHARHAVAEPHPARAHGRLVGFLQGSWRELQRVQWPDRRQVVQATGVVIGFVIVAGLYLAAADGIASKLMNFILK
jgi:preprotein translocase SecE subunit